MMPYFSIVIPLYNREQLVLRTINSCLGQDFDDLEIIVVDDGSLDGSYKIVEKINDPRIKLIHHEENRGVCPARNTGIANSSGEWILPIDSDDELLPNILSKIYSKTQEVAPEIKMIRFMNRLGTGELSPDPPLKNEIWNYEAYIRWVESTFDAKHSDASKVFRRACFEVVKYPEDRTLEAMFHLDFSREFKTMVSAEVMVMVHQDAINRLTRPDISRAINNAPKMIVGIEQMLASHGVALKKWAPRKYFQDLCGLATVQFLSGYRKSGFMTATSALRLSPFSLKAWIIIIFGLMGASFLAKLQSVRLQWLLWRRS